MKTEIQNLENKINELVLRMNNAEETLTTNATNEINSMRSELEKLINEFDLLKIKLIDENSDEKIKEEDIEDIVSLIDEFINNFGTNNFSNQTFSSREIEDVELSINYNCEVELENATIDVEDYFCGNFSFDYDEFVQFVRESDNNNKLNLLKFIPRELFDLIEKVIDKSVRDIDTTISFRRFNDFECEMDSYNKKINVVEITIDSDEFINEFNEEFDFNRNDIAEIIQSYHNFQSEENLDTNSNHINTEKDDEV
jgi:hypothetical protein